MSRPTIMSPSGTTMVEIDPVLGGRIAQITVDGTPLLVGRGDETVGPLAWGAYPMVPWAGRIREGRFRFRGETYHLPRNHGDHAMHGVGFTSPWSVTDSTATVVDLHLDLPVDERWPFGGSVDQMIEVSDDGLTCAMSVTSDTQAFPVSFGWHPWFRKPERLDFRPTAMYRRDDQHMAVDELVDVPGGPWDDCFVNHEPVRFHIAGIDLTMISACTDWVVYDQPAHATCIEPQTGPPDAFTIRPQVIEPGAVATASFRLTVERGSDDHRQQE